MVLRKQRTMAELAGIIASCTKTIDEYLSSKNLPQPSFAEDAPSPDFLPRKEDVHIHEVRRELADASKELHELSLGPDALFTYQTLSFHDCSALRTICEFDIPLNVPLQGTITYEELARKVNLEEDKLRRTLCYAYTMRMFCEPKPDHVAHSATSRMLATEPTAMNWLSHNTYDCLPAGTAQSQALKKWFPYGKAPAGETQYGEAATHTNGAAKDEEVVQAARTGMAYHNNSKSDPFTYWTHNEPDRIPNFLGSMKFISSSTTLPGREIEDVFDWKSLQTGTVVDVGGSAGHKGIIVAREAPQLNVVVQDLPDVVDAARKAAAALPAEDEIQQLLKNGRLKFEPHSFFEPQPITDAKAYFFSRVFHDWGDEDCVKILQNLVPSMSQGSYLVINDFVLVEPGTEPAGEERLKRSIDMQMMVVINSRERPLEHWQRLVERGSEGKLKFVKLTANGVSWIRQD